MKEKERVKRRRTTLSWIQLHLNNLNRKPSNSIPKISAIDLFLSALQAPYRGEAATHVSISHREAGLIDGLLKDEIDDAFQPLLRVDGQVRHLLHQLVELLRRQLVQDASHLPEEVLRGRSQTGS